jgi:hypothetical protein
MATIYLSSVDGDDGDSGADWANAMATAQAAMTAAGAGGRVYIDSTHSESFSGSSTTLTSPGTAASPQELLSVNRSTGALEAGASLAMTTAHGLGLFGSFYAYGLTISSATGNTVLNGGNATSRACYDHCTLECGGSYIMVTAHTYGKQVVFKDVTVEMLAAATCMIVNPAFRWVGGGLTGATVPNFLLTHTNAVRQAPVRLENLDLSTLSTVLASYTALGGHLEISARRCRLHASLARSTGTVTPGCKIALIACDSGTDYLRHEREVYEGVVSEDTVRIRDNSDAPYSFKMVSSANTHFHAPLRSFPIARYNAVEGEEITVRVYTLTDGVTLQNDEFWLEVNYLGNASYPIGSLESSAMADILATPANLTTSTEGWTTTDIASPTKQYAEVTFTPQESGPIEITACLAKASTTVYVDPDAEIS